MATESHSQIAIQAQTSIRSFAKLDDLLKDASQESKYDLSRDAILDEFARFNIWATNIKALQPHNKRSSLGARLRAAPKVARLVVENLEDLNETLNDLTSIVSGQREDRIISPRNEAQLSPQELDELVALELVDLGDLEPYSESSKLFKYCIEFVTNLYDLSLLIQRSTNRDRYSKALSSGGDPFNEQPDILHVEHKFPKLQRSPWLAERLGVAAARRRHYLRYCRTHHEDDESVRTSLVKREPKPATDLERSKRAPSRPPLLAQTTHIQTSRPSQVETETSKATTFMMPNFEDLEQGDEPELDEQSLGSYATTIGESSNTDFHVPLMPEGAGTGPFLCPYCHTIQQCKRRRVWKKHVFNDLRPYLCTALDCGLKLFADRNSWQQHEFETHWVEWYCRFCRHQPFTLREHLELHMRTRHEGNFTEIHLPYLLDISHRPVEAIAPSSCPFCDEWETNLVKLNREDGGEKVLVTPKQYREHVAVHMEQLALFTLPRGRIDADEDVDSTGANPGAESSLEVDDDFFDASITIKLDPALHVDAFEGKGVEVLRRLKAGEDVNASGRTWGSALGAAVAGEQPAVAKLLLDHGADVYMRCHTFETAVDASLGIKNDTLRQILLESKAIEERAEYYAAFKRQLEEAAETVDQTCTFANEFVVPSVQNEHIMIAEETFRALSKGVRSCASLIDINSKIRKRGLDTGRQTLHMVTATTSILCDYFRLLVQSFGIHERDYEPDRHDYTNEDYAFWSNLDNIFQAKVETVGIDNARDFIDFVDHCTLTFESLSRYYLSQSVTINTDISSNYDLDLPMRAEMHFEYLQNTIKELTKDYPDRLVTAKSVMGIRREVDVLKPSSEGRDPKPDTTGEISSQEDSTRAPRISSSEIDEEQQLSEANLNADALSMYQDSIGPATRDDKVHRWASTQSAEVLGDSSSVGALNRNSYSSPVATFAQDPTPMVQDTKVAEAELSTTPAQLKDIMIEFLKTIQAKLKDVLEALSQFRAKLPASAQGIITQQSDLFNQLQGTREKFRNQFEEASNTPIDEETFDPSSLGKHIKFIQIYRGFWETICGVAEKLFLVTLEDQEHWTVDTSAEKWRGIGDQFEWETGLSLTVAFTYVLGDYQRNALERFFERRSLLGSTSTFGDLIGASNGYNAFRNLVESQSL